MAATIRDAVEADLPALLDLYHQLEFGSRPEAPIEVTPAHRDVLAATTAREGLHLLVVEDAGRVVGTATYLTVPGFAHGVRPWAEVEYVVVDAAARGKGYGALLMRHAIELARADGCHKLALVSSNFRVEAHAFYEHLGFKTTQRSYRFDL